MSAESAGSSIDPNRHVEVLRRAVDDATQQLRAANFTLVSAALYLFVAGLGTSHRDLLLGRMVKLPIFDVEVSLLWFYLLAPVVLIILHFTVLSLCGTVAQRLHQLLEELQDDPDQSFVLSLLNTHPLVDWLARPPDQKIARLLLALSLVIPTLAMPIATLVWLESRFLPYQHAGFTGLHAIYVLLDLLVIWFMWHRVFRISAMERSRRTPATSTGINSPRFRDPPLVAGAILTSLIVIVATAPVGASLLWGFESFARLNVQRATISGDGSAEVRTRLAVISKDELDARLAAIGSFDQQKPDYFTSVFESATSRLGANLQGRSLRGAILTGTSLMGADLTNADLTAADLRAVDLRGAILEDATLDGAILSNAHLEAADLTNAKIRGADLPFSQLQGAILHGADFTGADLTGANLQFMRLLDQEPRSETATSQSPILAPTFRGAILKGAQFQGSPIEADRFKAEIKRTNLRRIDLRGADLRSTQMHGVDLSLFDLDGADMSGYAALPEDGESQDYVCKNGLVLADCTDPLRTPDQPPNFAKLSYDAARVVTIETLKNVGSRLRYLSESSICRGAPGCGLTGDAAVTPEPSHDDPPRTAEDWRGLTAEDVLEHLAALSRSSADAELPAWCHTDVATERRLAMRAFVHRVNEYRCQYESERTDPPHEANYLGRLDVAEQTVLDACQVRVRKFEDRWCLSGVRKDIPDLADDRSIKRAAMGHAGTP